MPHVLSLRLFQRQCVQLDWIEVRLKVFPMILIISSLSVCLAFECEIVYSVHVLYFVFSCEFCNVQLWRRRSQKRQKRRQNVSFIAVL